MPGAPTAHDRPSVPIAALRLTLACAVGFAFSANYTNHAPLVPLLQADFSFTQAFAGLLTTGIFLTHAGMQIPGGHLADRFGGKRVVLGALVLVCAGNVGLALAQSYRQLLVWKTITGIGTGTCFVAGARYLAQVVPSARLAKAQGAYGASILAGSGFIIFAIPRIAQSLGWRGAFWSTAAVAALVLVVWAVAAPDAQLRQHPTSRMTELMAHPELWRLGLVQMASFGLVIVIGSWVTQVLTKSLGIDQKSAGAIGSLVLLLGIVSRPWGGALLPRTGVRWLVIASLAVNAGACLLLATMAGSFAAVLAAIVMLGLGCGLPYAALFTRAAALFPGRAGAAMGLVNMLGIVMILVGAPLVGRLTDVSHTFTASFYALGGFAAAIAITSLTLERARVDPPG